MNVIDDEETLTELIKIMKEEDEGLLEDESVTAYFQPSIDYEAMPPTDGEQ